MKIERSCPTPADAKKARGGLRRFLCLSFVVAAVIAAVGAFASPRANQGSTRLSNASPANIIVVTTTDDSGPGSLRDALAGANDGDTIDATGVSGTILLTSGELNVDKNVTIGGPGANHLAVDGNGQSRVFYVNLGNTVTISGLTITNGSSGIYNDGGALTLSDCRVSGNSGSGVTNTGTQSAATMTVSNCIVSGNSGSGIVNHGFGDSATMAVTNCTVSGNSGSGIAQEPASPAAARR